MTHSPQQPAFQAPDVEEVGRLFPSFEVHSLIACGGMGAVYQATQRSLDRLVAIKMLPREFSTDDAFRSGFEAEAKAMAKLNHPNLVGVYDFGEVEGMLFIVMEYVAGKSLFHSAHGCLVEQAEALGVVIGICNGLAHAHEHGILHRDIKPSNILLDAHANPKIGDFGLARALEREIQEGEQIFGTPGYTAPEVLEPPFTIDQRADIFSVGVVLHELLTGKLPEDDPRAASKISGCNQRLDAVIRRATDPDPARRYASAMELAGELGKINGSPRAILTGSAAAAPGRAMAVAKPSALAPRGALARQGAYAPPMQTAQSSSGLGIVLVLVGLLVIAVVAYLVTQGKRREAPAPTPPAGKTETQPAAPESEPTEAMENASDILGRARSSIRQRAGHTIEVGQRDMKSNALAYQAALEAASAEMPILQREGATAAVSETFGQWQADGHRISDSIPGRFIPIPGATELHARHLAAQAAIEKKLASDISLQSGIYVLELQNQIEQLSKSGNQAAVDALEAEVRSVSSDPARFRSILRD